MPFSNAAVERIFSAVSLVKTKLRNRLLCRTVESVLCVRYGIQFMNVSLSFMPAKSMLQNFSDKMYHDNDTVDTVDGDIVEALDVMNECEEME